MIELSSCRIDMSPAAQPFCNNLYIHLIDMGAVQAAEELQTPIILQIAEVRLKNSPLEFVGPMMVSAAQKAKVDIAVHLDHGLTMETVKAALK